MPKARLSNATTWIEEGKSSRVKLERIQKKKQIVCLREETVKRLWRHRVETGKTISDIVDELATSYIPKY